jgi:DNA invertase Pin-like site-specific DNA recombinase
LSRIVGYIRVSTRGQLDGNSVEEQSKLILDKYSNAELFVESYSGAKERAIFDSLVDELQEGDLLVVTKLDRFCRTTKEGLTFIDNLMNKGANIHILNMGLIEDTPMGRLIVTNLLAFAEFERSMIIERTQGGKAIAKTKDGFKEGRPKKYSKEQIKNALNMLAVNGGTESYTSAARILRISKSTLVRANREYNKNKLLDVNK